jgi:hypothetical protein
VNEIAFTSGLSTSAEPTTEPEPVSTFRTPAGRPASAKHSATWSPVRGASCASFNTTVLPWISAGASFQTGMAMGKFQGVISPTTPRGRRTVYRRWSGTEAAYTSPIGRHASPAAKRRIVAARAVSMRASRSGFPISAVMSRATSSVRASIASAARWKIAARAGAGRAAHAGKAAAAAATATWTSATPDAWKTPVTSDGRHGSRFS